MKPLFEMLQNVFRRLLGDHRSVAFDDIIDDSYLLAVDFDAMLTFLYNQFFPRCV